MPMDKQLVVSSSPHGGIAEDTRALMLDVIIALTPALILAVFFFGFRALTLTLCSSRHV